MTPHPVLMLLGGMVVAALLLGLLDWYLAKVRSKRHAFTKVPDPDPELTPAPEPSYPSMSAESRRRLIYPELPSLKTSAWKFRIKVRRIHDASALANILNGVATVAEYDPAVMERSRGVIVL